MVSAEPAFRPQINFKRSIVSRIEQILFKAWMCILACLCLGGCAGLHYQVADPAASVNRTSFYIAAHPDDIELFMARNAWDEIEKNGAKVVFIVFSAGDDGNGESPNGNCESFYHARELAHIDAVNFWAGMSNSKDVHVVEERFRSRRMNFLGNRLARKSCFIICACPTEMFSAPATRAQNSRLLLSDRTRSTGSCPSTARWN